MDSSVSRLVIAAFAILAFFAGNLDMATGYGAGLVGHHEGAIVCEGAQSMDAHSPADFADADTGCVSTGKAQCGDGPACCSSICHAVILVSALHMERASAGARKSKERPFGLASGQSFLERPPRN